MIRSSVAGLGLALAMNGAFGIAAPTAPMASAPPKAAPEPSGSRPIAEVSSRQTRYSSSDLTADFQYVARTDSIEFTSQAYGQTHKIQQPCYRVLGLARTLNDPIMAQAEIDSLVRQSVAFVQAAISQGDFTITVKDEGPLTLSPTHAAELFYAATGSALAKERIRTVTSAAAICSP